MRKLPLNNFLGYIAGAGLVYVFFALFDLILYKGFSWFFFLGYWDFQILFMIFINEFRK